MVTRAGASAPSTSAPERLLGHVLGGYRLESLIGGGGMGLVYRGARVEGDGPERAAVKVLSFAFASDPEFVARFRREADALLRLRHPHLIEVYAKGEYAPAPGAPPVYFFVMELFDGEDLRAWVQRGPVEVPAALAIVAQAAAGLAYAHEHGIVHRDIKPANILVRGDPSADGWVKVVDFGVAQLASPGHTLTSLTRSDLILGTFNYMSPEQRVDASRIDHRADVYALGVVAYELLTGRLPLGAFEPPSELRAELSVAADAALMGALRREPAQRPRSVDAFATALVAAAGPRPSRRGWALAVAAGALAAVAVSVAVAMGPGGAPAKVAATRAVKTKAVAKAAPKAPPVEPAKPPETKSPPPKVSPALVEAIAEDAAYVERLAAAPPPVKTKRAAKAKLPKGTKKSGPVTAK